MLSSIFDAFVKASPISVMMRGVMEFVFRPERLDEIFESHAKLQSTRELLFSSLVNLLSLVVCGIHPSVNAAYKAEAEALNVTRGALYQKLNGVEIEVSAALLRETAHELGQLIQQMGGQPPALLPGYQVRILDGNALATTEHRLQVLRSVGAAAFSFSLALVTYNSLATLRAALASVHGVEKIEAALSDFYVVDEIQGTYRGMMIAVAPDHWQCFSVMSLADLAELLKQLAAQVNLKRFLKQPRKNKILKSPRVNDPKHPHVSTAKLLSGG
jgi:hypothetical protein